MQHAARLLFLCAAAIALGGCTSTDEVSFKSGGMTHTFMQGDAATKGFPLPLYPGAKSIGANAASGDADDEHFMMLTSADPVEKVSTFYQDKLKADGWTVSKNMVMPQLVKLDGEKQGYEASALISSDDKQTSISLSYSKAMQGTPKILGQEFTPDKLNPPTD
jgi:hypothetical protein